MREPLFSEQQATELAEKKFLHEENLKLAKDHQICSLQAAVAFDAMLQIFVFMIDRIRTQKELGEFLRRLKENANVDFQSKSKDMEVQKNELSIKLRQMIDANQKKITRLSTGRKK